MRLLRLVRLLRDSALVQVCEHSLFLVGLRVHRLAPAMRHDAPRIHVEGETVGHM